MKKTYSFTLKTMKKIFKLAEKYGINENIKLFDFIDFLVERGEL